MDPVTGPSRLRRLVADTRPFQSPHYTRLFVANIITVIGAQLTVITVPAQLWAITRDSAIVGLTGIVGLVPLVIFGLWGGAIADAFDRLAAGDPTVEIRSQRDCDDDEVRKPSSASARSCSPPRPAPATPDPAPARSPG